ncbi:MAG: hypothetical protein K2L99_05625 [Muribaculaceae bacterium]|nr:hypothetical protein [Muribaculaceae bacterium]
MPGFAQSSFEDFKRQAQERFEQFKEEKQSEFEAYRARVNKEFSEYMRRAWARFEPEPAIPAPPMPEPPEPVVVDPEEEPTNDPQPYAKVVPLPEVPPQPAPLVPDAKPDKPAVPLRPEIPKGNALTFDFYGRTCTVPFDESLKISLRGIEENNVADAWAQLAADKSVEPVKSCIALRDEMRLPDWGYFRLVQKLSEAAFPNRKNEANLLQMFLLTQSGYKARIGRCADRLVVLIPSREQIYNYSFIPIKGVNYYVVDRSVRSASTYVYNREFPREQMFSLAIGKQPVLEVDGTSPQVYSSPYGGGISAEVSVNKNLIDFYNDYPLSSHWNLYAKASLSNEVKEQLYPVLKSAIADKGATEGANILLRFVQKAFDYKTDQDQFGDERPLFGDETFYYPYSDCEDRAILYAVLVRDLLGLDAVLVYYPGHLATAVKLGDEVSGDYFTIEGEKYTVCDPTYINSNVGMAMPQFKGASAEIMKL